MDERELQHLLLLHPSQPENAYGRFTAEILRGEGLSSFCPHDLDALVARVAAGASLLCLQPSPALAARLLENELPGAVSWTAPAS